MSVDQNHFVENYILEVLILMIIFGTWEYENSLISI